VDDLTSLTADPELAAMFIAETQDHLGSIETTLLQLERELLQNEPAPRDAALLDDLFRPFHTIKGNAGTLGVRSIANVAHSVEDLLDAARARRLQLGLGDVELILRAVDLLSTMVTEVGRRLAGQDFTNLDAVRIQLTDALDRRAVGDDAGGVHPAADLIAPGGGEPDGPSGATPAEASQPIKVDPRKLDALVEMVAELTTAQALLRQNAALQVITDEALTWQLAQLRRITRDVQRNVMALRLVPVRQMFQKMARLVRDVSRSAGKPAELLLAGEDTELDRRMVEEIADPLMHMLRNAVDHGIEDRATRERLGKPVPARVSLRAHQDGGHIVIAVSDDGAGIDADRVLEKATLLGLVRPGQTLSAAEVHALIFGAGLSTADRVSAISGRGVGMDVVRRNVEALRGEIDIESARGEGTTFRIKLPLTLAILGGFVVKVGRERFVLSMPSVVESLPAADATLITLHGRPFARVRGTAMPIVSLRSLFGIASGSAEGRESTIVVVGDERRRVALLVDDLIGRQEVLARSLDRMMEQVRFVCSTAILADGRIGLILDARGLIAAADGGAAEAA
jgi:two-component system chemotaxis sensor kinase CheA